jgi:hypothetical protein
MSPIRFVSGGSEKELTTVCPVCPRPKFNLILPKRIQMGYRRMLLVLVIGNMYLHHDNSEYVKVV